MAGLLREYSLSTALEYHTPCVTSKIARYFRHDFLNRKEPQS
jgi:hypothetical protein